MQEAHQGSDHFIDLRKKSALLTGEEDQGRAASHSHQCCPTQTRSPGKAISGAVVMAILARAWAALLCPTSVPSRARGMSACRVTGKGERDWSATRALLGRARGGRGNTDLPPSGSYHSPTVLRVIHYGQENPVAQQDMEEEGGGQSQVQAHTLPRAMWEYRDGKQIGLLISTLPC